jgi:hypothetical protein
MKTLKAIRRLLALDRGARSLLLQAWVRVVTVRAALWLLPFRVVHAAVTARAQRVAPPPGQPVDRIVWAVVAASRRVPRATCLTRAFAGTLLLAANGHAASPRLGVAKAGEGRIRAHAWIECGGQTLLGDADMDELVPLPLPDAR